MKTIILKVDNRGLHYNTTAYVSWNNTNLPANDFLFSSHDDIYWEVELVGYNINTESLSIHVLNYYSKEQERFEQQVPKKPIKAIVLSILSEQQLKAQLSFYKPESMNAFWKEEEENCDYSPKEMELTAFDIDAAIDMDGLHFIPEVEVEQEDKAIEPTISKRKIEVLLQERLMETTFGLGVIKLRPFVKEVGQLVNIIIENDAIIPEFDHIKPYFAKALKSKYVKVKATIEIEGEKILSVHAQSAELERINDDLIQLVRSIAIEKTLEKPTVIAIDKSLFTGDELFDNFQEENIGDVFDRSDDELLQDILGLKNVRNVKQLQYLAGKLHESDTRLRFSLSPIFGFIFLVKGDKMNHYIWELLNSHATYIWSFDKQDGSITKQYQAVEKILSFIREQGRQQYRQSYLNEGITFHLVTHEKVNSKMLNSFPKWKNRLLEKLV